jgi:hypothetical protein
VTAARVLEVARSQLGTVESPPGSNRQKYGAVYGTNGVAWCAIFTWWCFQQAGDGALHPKTAYTPALADWYRQRGQWSTAPRVGSLVLFDFPGDGVNRISHVGIVEAINRDGSVVTIEGNTSAGTSGSQRDGGGVYRRTRRTGIVGYGHPAYGAPSPTTGEPELNAEETKMLREIHGQLNNLFASRVEFGVLGQGEPAQRVRDTVGGFAVNADARSYETRELVRALRTELAAVARLVESQRAAFTDALSRLAGQGNNLTPEQIKDAVAAAIRDNLVRVDVEIAGSPAGKD